MSSTSRLYRDDPALAPFVTTVTAESDTTYEGQQYRFANQTADANTGTSGAPSPHPLMGSVVHGTDHVGGQPIHGPIVRFSGAGAYIDAQDGIVRYSEDFTPIVSAFKLPQVGPVPGQPPLPI